MMETNAERKRTLSTSQDQASSKRPKPSVLSKPKPLLPLGSTAVPIMSAPYTAPSTSDALKMPSPAAIQLFSPPSPFYHPLFPAQSHRPELTLPPPALAGTPNHKPNTAYEREQLRRQSHSTIEKRRRERINDKIHQLKDLIPACSQCKDDEPIVAPSYHQPLHKLSILQAAIDYVHSLHGILLDAAAKDDPETLQLLKDDKIIRILTHAKRIKSSNNQSNGDNRPNGTKADVANESSTAQKAANESNQ